MRYASLSYTTFVYSNLSVASFITKIGANSFRGTLVSFDVTNTGQREGAEVAQVYVADRPTKVPRPAKELKGFSKVILKPREKRQIKLTLDERALSYYDVDSKQWHAEPGQFEVLVGSSSDSIQLQRKLTLAKPAATAAIPESSKNR